MKKRDWIVLSFLVGFILRFSLSFQGGWAHPTDQYCFFTWAQGLFSYGFPHFYESISFCDYPPGYFYILYPIGWIFTKFGATYIVPWAAMLLRLPAMLADLGIAAVLGRIAYRRRGENAALITVCTVLFCPLLILNSAVWAQIDSIWGLALLLAIFWRKQRIKSAVTLAIALLIKPQALLFFPIMAAFYFDREHPVREYVKVLATGILVVEAVSFPFCGGNYQIILNQYLGTMTGGYPYATVNAFNLYGLLGANWMELTQPFLMATYGFWGKIMIGVSVLGGLLCFFHWKKGPWLSAAVMMTTLFLFGPMMHERYWFPGILLLIAAYADSDHENRLCLYSFVAAALVNFLNNLLVLVYTVPNYLAVPQGTIAVVSLLTLAAGGFAYYVTWRERGNA